MFRPEVTGVKCGGYMWNLALKCITELKVTDLLLATHSLICIGLLRKSKERA
jgi:hypothetical protein